MPQSSLAETKQASMKAAYRGNISLVDVVYADISDSARLVAKWFNGLKRERCHGSSPSCLEFEDCSESLKIDRTIRFAEENSRFDSVEAEKSPQRK